MRKALFFLIVVFIGCRQRQEVENHYLEGIPINHAKNYRTTKESFGKFYLHSWMHDTVYRHTGSEVQIEPIDSTLQFKTFAQGSRLLENSQNKYLFMLEPTDSIVILMIVVNNQDTIRKAFISPYLPLPSLTTKVHGDSVLLSLHQTDKRLQKLLPMDTRYIFETSKGFCQQLSKPKDSSDLTGINVFRLNYRNDTYPVKMAR